jgi:hypothetical protein
MSWLDKYEEGGYLGTTNKGFDYNGAWGGQFQEGGEIPMAQNGSLSSRQKRGIELLLKDTENAKKDEKELKSKGQIKNPKSIKYKNQKKELQKRMTDVHQDNRTDYVRELDEEKGKAKEFKRKLKENILKPADVATDVMQLGNFVPHPIGQTIGKIGNIGGAAIDAYQAADDVNEENYGSAAVNIGSLILPMGLEAKTFRRNSKYLQPGQPLYPFSPQANLPANATFSQMLNIPKVSYIEPFTKVRGMTDASLLANRALLGTLATETLYDSGAVPEFQSGGSLPGSVGFTYARTQGIPSEGPHAKKTMPSAQNGQEMRYFQEGLDWRPKTISREGSVIRDEMGQWAHPGEITQIDSPYITMKGVPYPVLGVSNTGDVQMMYPEQEYEFDGDSVIEYPMARNGINNLDARPLVKLDQLTNFTNYNKPQPGSGWLSKYE